MMIGVVLAMRVRPSRPILVGVLMCLLGALPMALLGLSAPLWSVIAAPGVRNLRAPQGSAPDRDLTPSVAHP
jgi:hypothetical protein